MLINEVCRQCSLTKKAVEYYIDQKLVQPEILENGYRSFSISDVERLKKIAILRRLGLSVHSIKEVLDVGNQAALYKVYERKRLEIEAEKSKQALLQQLAEKDDWDYISSQLEVLEKSYTILQRMLNAFPGYYGKYIILHFAPYLNEPVITDEQNEAFETVVNFLDNVSIVLPADLQQYLNEVALSLDDTFFENVSANMDYAVRNTEKYMEDNREVIKQYMLFKQSDEYRASSAYRMHELFRQLNSENGYDTVFIPAMKKLSISYREYIAALEKANKIFMSQYQQTTL